LSSEKSDAIVLRAVPWSETSYVVTLFTREFGKISAVAKGARRLRSPFESSIDLLAKSYIVFIHKGHDALEILTEAKLIRRFRSGQRSLLPLYCGYYLAELLTTLTQEHQRIPELFDLADVSLEKLDAGGTPAEIVLHFEMQLMKLLGHQPTFRLCASCSDPVESQGLRGGLPIGITVGGVLCPTCLPGQRYVLRVRAQTLDSLIESSEKEWHETSTKIAPATRGELRFVMEKFVSVLADRPLRLTEFLEELQH
jgi:DNA repair protein RecO (recombination protein O)